MSLYFILQVDVAETLYFKGYLLTLLAVFILFYFILQVDVAGTLYFWGVSIDTASSILLTLSVGLAVDYAAHIGHTFMIVNGTRNGKWCNYRKQSDRLLCNFKI